MAVDVSLRDGALVLGRLVTLFEDDSIIRGTFGKSAYDVSSDGFIAIDTTESEPPPTELELVLNWGEELKRLAPPTYQLARREPIADDRPRHELLFQLLLE